MKDPAITDHCQDTSGNQRYPVVYPTATATAHGATATILKTALKNLNHTNTGAGGAIVLTLPYAKNVPGATFRLYLTVAQQVSFSPQATDKIYLAGSGVANKDLVIAGVIGNYADLYSDGVDYLVTHWSGVVTKEA